MIRLYIGHVKEIDDNQIIGFTIDGVYDNTDVLPKAVPLSRISRVARVDESDEVLIVQPNSDIELYYYVQFRENSEYVSLEYNDTKLKLIKNGDINVVTDGKSGNINVKTKSKGNITIDTSESKEGNVTINTAGKVNIKSTKEVKLTSEAKITVDSPTTEFKASSVTINGMGTIGFLPLTTVPYGGGPVTPTSTAPCTGLTLRK